MAMTKNPLDDEALREKIFSYIRRPKVGEFITSPYGWDNAFYVLALGPDTFTAMSFRGSTTHVPWGDWHSGKMVFSTEDKFFISPHGSQLKPELRMKAKQVLAEAKQVLAEAQGGGGGGAGAAPPLPGKHGSSTLRAGHRKWSYDRR